MRLPRLALVAVLVLAACATPQERCMSAASQSARINAQLIAETRANIARGFGVRQEERVTETRSVCRGRTESGEVVRIRCNDIDVTKVQVPVALDLEAERAKLDSLLLQRDRLAASTQEQIAQCRVLYPE